MYESLPAGHSINNAKLIISFWFILIPHDKKEREAKKIPSVLR